MEKRAEKESPSEPTFNYKKVEDVLAKVFGTSETTILALRGRINGLWRNGFSTDAPGRGKVIRYTTNNIYDLALALSLAEFGLPPRIIVQTVKPGKFETFLNEMKKQKGLAHLLLIYFPSLFYEVALGEPMTYVPIWSDRFKLLLQEKDMPFRRYAVIDLTDLKQRVDQELARA